VRILVDVRRFPWIRRLAADYAYDFRAVAPFFSGDPADRAAWADAIARSVETTRALFEQGRAVCDGVGGRLRLELRFTWLGGTRVLERVERGRSRLLDERPTLGAADVPILLWRAAHWTRVQS